MTKIIYYTQETIREEAEKYGDILQLNVPPNPQSNYLQMLAALTWVADRCPHRFILRMNMDVLVQAESLRLVIEDAKDHKWDEIPAILGDVIDQEPEESGKKSNFPVFVYGSIYILTRPAYRRIVEACRTVRPISLEEVYITGSCADKGQVQRVRIKHFEMERELKLWRKMFSCLPNHVLSVSNVGKDNVLHYWQKAVRAGCYLPDDPVTTTTLPPPTTSQSVLSP